VGRSISSKAGKLCFFLNLIRRREHSLCFEGLLS
jgi:hypothetical protein